MSSRSGGTNSTTVRTPVQIGVPRHECSDYQPGLLVLCIFAHRRARVLAGQILVGLRVDAPMAPLDRSRKTDQRMKLSRYKEGGLLLRRGENATERPHCRGSRPKSRGSIQCMRRAMAQRSRRARRDAAGPPRGPLRPGGSVSADSRLGPIADLVAARTGLGAADI